MFTSCKMQMHPTTLSWSHVRLDDLIGEIINVIHITGYHDLQIQNGKGFNFEFRHRKGK